MKWTWQQFGLVVSVCSLTACSVTVDMRDHPAEDVPATDCYPVQRSAAPQKNPTPEKHKASQC